VIGTDVILAEAIEHDHDHIHRKNLSRTQVAGSELGGGCDIAGQIVILTQAPRKPGNERPSHRVCDVRHRSLSSERES